jgi:hypothetical protein
MVCTFALVDRAADAWKRLGHLVQLQVARGVPVTDQGVRLAAENPVFVVWSDPPAAPAHPPPAAPAHPPAAPAEPPPVAPAP